VRGVLLFLLMVIAQMSVASHAAAIHEAAKRGDVAAIEAALEAGAEVNAVDGGGTALYFAARRGQLEAVKMLVKRGADVNAKAKLGQPLMGAVAKQRIEIIKFLLANGADPNAHVDSQTVLHVAAGQGCLECVKLLVEAKADVNARYTFANGKNVWVLTPVHLAIHYEFKELADYLMSHGVVLPRPAPISDKLATADIAKGKAFFDYQCLGCHFIKPDQGQDFGPNLWNVVGRDKASLPFNGYSKTLRALDGVWTYEDLNTFLSGPAVTTPGVNMQVEGAPDEAVRVNLIAYLRTLSDEPLPLP
jgi:cytochrome c